MQAYYYLASTYGTGGYGSSYSGSSMSTTTASSGGVLTNMGIAVASIVTVAAIVLLISVVVRIWRSPGRDTEVK